MITSSDHQTKCLSANKLEKSFGSVNVVDDISITVRRGETVAILGPNGAGKTTLLNIVAGTLKPDSGRISIDGTDATRMPVFARARLGLSYLPQEPSVFRGLSVENNIMVALESCYPDKTTRLEVLDRILHEFGLSSVRPRNAAKLSGGMRRRCEVARALASNPRYLMLDEPFAGVDPIAVSDLQDMISRIRDSGLGILISDHNVRETLSIVDHAYIIVAGKVLAYGTPMEIVSNDQVRQFYLGNTLDQATGFGSHYRGN